MGKRQERDRPYHYDPGAAKRMRKLREGTQKRLQCKHGGQLHCKREGCPNFFLTKKEWLPSCNHNHGRKCSVDGCPNRRRERIDAGFKRGPTPEAIIRKRMQSIQQQVRAEEMHKWDVTHVAKEVLQMIGGLDKSVTLIRLAALWRGTKNKVHIKGINLYDLPCYGKGRSYSKGEADRIMRSLICEKNHPGGFRG